MAEFKPKPIIFNGTTDSYKYQCKNIHDVTIDKKVHKISNNYRFNRDVPYLIKNQEDYDELIANDMFDDYVEPEEKPVSAPSETSKERKLREKAEAKADKEAVKKAKEDKEEKPLKIVPAKETDGADTITERPQSDSVEAA